MNRNILALKIIFVSFVLLFQTGCQEAAGGAQKAVKTETLTAKSESKAQETDASEVKTGKLGPRILFENVDHHFGDIVPGGTLVCEFKFKNNGDELLIIKDVTKTCGCTPYTLSKKEYLPGESGVLKVKYNADKRAGAKRKRLYVRSNDKAKSKITLTIRAKVVAKIEVKPKKLNLLFKGEHAECPILEIKSTDKKPFAITKFKSSNDAITAEFDPSAKATMFTIRPKVDMKQLGKYPKGHIQITLTHPDTKSVRVSFDTLAKFKADPSSLVFFNAEPQKPLLRELYVLSNYNETFDIDSTSSKNGMVKVLEQEKVGNRYKLKVQITPPADVGTKKRVFTDVLNIQIKDSEKLEVACTGFYPRKTKKAKQPAKRK